MVHLLKSCALMWWRGLHAMVILKAIPDGTLVPDGFNCAEQFLGEKTDKSQHLVFQIGGGWRVNVSSP